MKKVTTEIFAKLNYVKTNTVLKRHCEHGHYFSVKPEKLPNGRLLWPVEDDQEATTNHQEVA